MHCTQEGKVWGYTQVYLTVPTDLCIAWGSTGEFLKCHLCDKLSFQYLIFSSTLGVTEAVKTHGERSGQHRRGYNPQRWGYKMLGKVMAQGALKPCFIYQIQRSALPLTFRTRWAVNTSSDHVSWVC